ncbi:MAG: ATP-grasp domain-containing protein [Synergistaceae bacterium]|nr:ATP-grasp domain-containing protein [Synergistaceae bacterium]
MKKLLILGGSRYINPIIETAHRLGIYVVTCDYLPDNYAHKYSDEYCNVSVIDKEAVLNAAIRLKADGIISFACDPGVVSAAYVAEKLGLPFQGSYESVRILQDKGLFRKFLADNGFNTPKAKRYTRSQIGEAQNDIDIFRWPVIVKPVDSAGSKGVTRVDSPENLAAAIDKAIAGSLCGAFIIEEFLTFNGYHSSTDPFTVDGELKFITFSDQLFDKGADNPYTPSGIKWPSTMKPEHQQTLTAEIQRLMRLLNMKTGIYNIETCVSSDEKPYIMEVSPRGGGCRIAELEDIAYGVHLVENEIRKAVGMPLLPIEPHECEGSWSEMVLHLNAENPEVFKRLTIDPEIMRKYVAKLDFWLKEGDEIRPFTGANSTLGIVFLRADSRNELDDVLSRVNEWFSIEVNSGNTYFGGGVLGRFTYFAANDTSSDCEAAA